MTGARVRRPDTGQNYRQVRHFTPEEANEALAVVRPLVERLVARRRDLLQREEELRSLRGTAAGNGGRIEPALLAGAAEAVSQATAEIAETIAEIEAAGAVVKDLDRGLVDFPARHPDGETVLLCWHLGEDEIRFWHGLEEGFAGRKPLPF
jgi:hypothetical protein